MMKKFVLPKDKNNMSYQLIRWFLTIFSVVFLVFCLVLIPVFGYVQNVFAKLQTENISQKLNNGVAQIESVVNNVINTSQSMVEDSLLRQLRYTQIDYAKIPLDTRKYLKKSLYRMQYSQGIATDTILQFDENTAASQKLLFWGEASNYYPDFFCVDDLSFAQWQQVLVDNKYGFLPLHHIKTNEKEYDAIIYAVKWYKSAYMFTCLDIADIKELLITETEQDGCYVTLTVSEDTVIYSDLPQEAQSYQTMSRHIESGNLTITIYISDLVFQRRMQPLYLTVLMYGILCLVFMACVVICSAYFSVHPFLEFARTLEKCKNIFREKDGQLTVRRHHSNGLPDLFDHISHKILDAEDELENYKIKSYMQQKFIKVRILEKAINGSLISPADINLFYTNYPDFPKDGYRLMLIRLRVDMMENGTFYEDPMLLLSSFLQSELPSVYQQQNSNTELLLLIDDRDFEHCHKVLDFVVDNINREEACYEIRCYAGKTYHHLEELPIAYKQLLNMEGVSFADDRTRVCMPDDVFSSPQVSFSLPDFMTLYTAITHGNREAALEQLRNYSDELLHIKNGTLNRHVYELIRTILNAVKVEYPQYFIEEYIPAYNEDSMLNADGSLYAVLSEVICRFCDKTTETFGQKLVRYIDTNFRDCNLCITSLETYFNSSATTIRKIFKAETNMTVAGYIERKRMQYASELLAKNQKSVSEIAIECGYANANSFYKAYRRVYGHAPSGQITDLQS